MQKRFNLLSLIALIFTISIFTSHAKETAPKEIKSWNKENTKLLKDIYIKMVGPANDRESFKKTRDGIALLVFNALASKAIYSDQDVAELHLVFGKDNFLTPLPSKKRFNMVPLVAPKSEKSKRGRQLLNTAGSEWYLVFMLNDEDKIYDVALRHTTMKEVLMRFHAPKE